MIVKRVNLCALDTGSLTLGYVGENDHTQIRINCASVFADYPAAVVSMTVKAPSGVVYPREVETDGQVVIWTITDSDTASAGNGQIQLTFTEDGTIVKTVIAVTTVRASLVGDNPPPDPITDWIDEAGEALAKLEGMTASATQLPAGEDPTAEVEVVDGHYNIALGIPGGDTESIIDDTAGVGDVTKVWSANKSATELSELKSAIDSKAPAIFRDASGDIVSFADGADGMPLSACSVSVDPVQDLHGQANPYPAGGGKNLIPLMVTALKALNTRGTWSGNVYTESGVAYTVQEDSSGNVIGVNVNGTASANSFFIMMTNATVSDGSYILSGCPTGGSDTTFAQYVYTNNAFWDTGSGVTVSISTAFSVNIRVYNGATVSNKVFAPMLRSASVTDSSFAPYSNICPISGRTGAQIYRTGKNLLFEYTAVGGYGMTGSVIENSGGGIRFSGVPTWTTGVNKAFKIADVTNVKKRFVDVASVKVFCNSPYCTVKSAWFSTNDGRIVVSADTVATTDNINVDFYIMVYIGEEPTEFAPYVGTVYPISWQTVAGTVYGGNVNPLTGVLTVDRAIVDMGTRAWSKNGDRFADGTKIVPNPVSQGTWGVSNPIAICSSYKYGNIGSGSGVDNAFGFYNGYLYARDTAYETAADFKTAVSGVMIVYKLATPVTYQLDPVQITTLIGENTMWADTGAISVTYPADTQTYIDSAISTATDPDGNVIQVSGSTPSITGESGKRYVCGTVDSISITPPQTGIIDVIFTSGTTPTVLTVPNTVMFPAWFDSTSLDASTVYEINIADGVYGAVMAWT